ncbi:MAG: HAMP domain-containing histidine kinase [Clostridia bacterium]|nr:HAMP domain-containing histidine kinase [Clostridia bacterium]
MDFTKIIIICLFLLFAVFLIKYISLKKQIKSFGRQVEQRKNIEYGSPIKVDNFDRDIVELAVKLNEHTDIQRSLDVEYKRSREQLNNVISGISHDFRTPLTAALGYLQMIEKSGELTGKNAEYLEIALQKNVYLKELSDEFFELSKLENGQENVALESINLSNLISDFVMEQYGWMQEREITPDFEISDGIVIESNLNYVMRITENLFSNAQKYTLKTLGVSVSKNESRVVFSVFNDTEESMDIDITRVFEPFYKPVSRNKSGSGLGLYVVKCLSDKLGIEAKAEFDKNGFFRITVIF